MLATHDIGKGELLPSKAPAKVIAMIVLMNLIFSFDSILSALAITRLMPLLAGSIVISTLLMLLLADGVATFLKKNRQYEVLGLFVLLIVGVVLLGEGGHEAHMKLFGYAIEPMSKATFYFSISVLVLVDVLQSKYQKKLGTKRAQTAG
jgi:predicted tellurium resistance membrane protein TerC